MGTIPARLRKSSSNSKKLLPLLQPPIIDKSGGQLNEDQANIPNTKVISSECSNSVICGNYSATVKTDNNREIINGE